MRPVTFGTIAATTDTAISKPTQPFALIAPL
jgi:hypothetical protein